MARNYYYQKRVQEHQREISRGLLTLYLLKDVEVKPRTAKQWRQIVLRIAPAAIVIITLLLLHFSG